MSNLHDLTIIDRLNITLDILNMTHLIGKIKIYAGTVKPAGYVWCDGTNGTPNLTDKYIISGQSSEIQTTFGNNQFANNMIRHTHNVNVHDIAVTSSNSNVFNAGNNQFNIGAYFNEINSITSQKILQIYNEDGGSSRTPSDGLRHQIVSNAGHDHNMPKTEIAREVSFDFAYDHKVSFKNNAKNVSLGNVGDGANYEPPYIYIGFIMKDPNTIL